MKTTPQLPLLTLTLACTFPVFSGAAEEKTSGLPKIKQTAPAPHYAPRIPPPDAKAAEVADGYQASVFLTGLQYPTSIEFDGVGKIYIAESGNIDGDWVAPARVFEFPADNPAGNTGTVVADQLSGPVTDLLWHDGRLYISHRGKISVLEGGKVRDLVSDLPSWGDHHNNQLTVGPDGKIYVGIGTATNSGVVGVDNYLLGWLLPWPDFCDVPGKDITLVEQQFESADPLSALAKNKAASVQGSAFAPFGKTLSSLTVKGQAKATGAIVRIAAAGGKVELYAWGLRNPFGLIWSPEGKLYASENGLDERGVRHVANAPDNLWEIKEGAWYGWPDFASGIPVTDPRFKAKGKPSAGFLMKEHPPVEKPLMTFEPHASVVKMDFSPSEEFGHKGQMFLAASGDFAPGTALEQKRAGYWVKRLDLASGKAEPFFHTKPSALGEGDMAYVTTAGPKRPIDVRFHGDALYVVDIGAVTFTQSGVGPAPRPFPGSGVVWKITRSSASSTDVKAAR